MQTAQRQRGGAISAYTATDQKGIDTTNDKLMINKL